MARAQGQRSEGPDAILPTRFSLLIDKRRRELRAQKLAEGLIADLRASILRAQQHGQTPNRLEERSLMILETLTSPTNTGS